MMGKRNTQSAIRPADIGTSSLGAVHWLENPNHYPDFHLTAQRPRCRYVGTTRVARQVALPKAGNGAELASRLTVTAMCCPEVVTHIQ